MRGKCRERVRTITTGIVDRVISSNTTSMVGVGLITKLTTLPIEVAIAGVYTPRYGFLSRKVWALHLLQVLQGNGCNSCNRTLPV